MHEFQSAIYNINNLHQLIEAFSSKKRCYVILEASYNDLLKSIFTHLELKGKLMICMKPLQDEIYEFWSVLLLIDSTLTKCTTTKKRLKTIHCKTALCEFIKHCCKVRHYSFQIKKCGQSSCSICKPGFNMLETLSFLPDQIPKNDDHYESFSDVYRQTTSEQHRPSLIKNPQQKDWVYSQPAAC